MQRRADHPVLACVAEDGPTVAKTLAAAFQDDPVMRFILPDPDTRRARMPRIFALLFEDDQANGACYRTADGQAATLWQAPGSAGFSWPEKIRALLPWWRATGSGLLRALAYSDASDANRPAEPHWYLHVAGCAPAARGRGCGRAVIRAGLDRADHDGVAAYLETSNPKNLGYYGSLGFAVTHEWRVGKTLVSCSMRRPAPQPQ